ncbi:MULTISPECIES: GMC family oxidoreductase [Pseudonocardia]|uniref:Fructose dehydrogenase large subunit n=2 Tax=Pseudonocardia TaxID=1847 RepID=A0A1Y2MKU7_PSEAH|nr:MULTISPECIES: GMC family oxidoreductase [Pseudonocardia]OSY35893.1 Fructose dehydrogenase large subunit [Pseudonocardia autotrophica]TDN73998.1 choline dehydrogenase-like flavoprotein [Pseudonocardia autotrophica]BBG04755.1 2-keto-gluconate dehydrogenase [Pseudonocardia autotrophica]GEC28693.1 2-keto-gluconate dehydrogenase [Pseudonocardia saturnea]
MTRFDYDDSDVVVIVGSGAGGGTLAHELCRRGFKTVVLEAGPHLTGEDYHNDEWAAFGQMAWTDPRTTSGSWAIADDFPNLPAWIVKAVGGTTTHWAGACPRFKSHEFAARTTYGDIEGADLLDWPITLSELEPYYDQAEIKMGVTHRHGRPPLPANNNYKVFANGADKLGYRDYSTGPYATNAEPYDGRPASIQDGFNFQGDKHGSKWSTLVAELPKAEATGNLDLRPDSQAVQILHGPDGRATGVLYVDRNGTLRRQRAAVVSVAGNSIETARLLLLSASTRFPDGMANSSGQVGRNYMRHTTGTVWGQFDKPVRMYRGETMAGVIADESRLDTGRGFVGGYYMQTIALGPAFFAKFVAPGSWGPKLAEIVDGYLNTAGMWIVGEDMPQGTNRITLSDTVDEHGIPVANVHFDDHPNDVAMRRHGQQQGAAVYKAVGAHRTIETPPYPSTHNLGTCRMSQRPGDGVVDRFGRAHDVPNLFVTDGSVFTTGAAANPTLTIVALATRQADFIASDFRTGRN